MKHILIVTEDYVVAGVPTKQGAEFMVLEDVAMVLTFRREEYLAAAAAARPPENRLIPLPAEIKLPLRRIRSVIDCAW